MDGVENMPLPEEAYQGPPPAARRVTGIFQTPRQDVFRITNIFQTPRQDLGLLLIFRPLYSAFSVSSLCKRLLVRYCMIFCSVFCLVGRLICLKTFRYLTFMISMCLTQPAALVGSTEPSFSFVLAIVTVP